MRIGFLTAIFSEWDLDKLLKWAYDNGFEALEVYAGPRSRHIDPDKVLKGHAGEVRRKFEEKGIMISALAFYPNNLDPDEKKRRENHEHIRKMIEAASQLDVSVICTFVGAVKNFLCYGIEESLRLFREEFLRIVDHAKDHEVKIAFENCPMGGWNIAFAPFVWDEIFKLSPILGLNFDPSHLVWQGIDCIAVAREYSKRIFHVHAKDTEILRHTLSRNGIYSRGWWRYRIPGWGVINWRALISALREGGYDYVLSVEMEDPIFRADEGLVLGLKYLKSMLGH
ncbi:MAG: sugar phosphate isomerase/epimerase [Thermoprotei archaeon]|nr:MAG: sugar phosphate isomerase/epimerase [Thermoprotei archaeon]